MILLFIKWRRKPGRKIIDPLKRLPTVSKVFERLLDKQIIDYMGPYLSSLLCGFRKGYNALHALLRMLEKWKTSLDNGDGGWGNPDGLIQSFRLY